MLANVSLLFHIIWIFQRLKINHIGTTYINVHRTVLQILYPFIFDMSKISIILFAKSFLCGTTFIGKPSTLHDIHVNSSQVEPQAYWKKGTSATAVL